MNTDNASLVSKLILLVLSLILVCLVLIVIRAYTDRTLGKRRQAAAAQAGSTVDEPAEAGVEPSPPPPIRRALTNQVRSTARVPQSPRANSDSPVAQPPSESPNSGAVAFQGISGFGVAPGAGGVEGEVAGTFDAEITGVATLLGMPKPEIPIDLGPSCGRLNRKRPTTRHYVVNSAGQLANVFVYISQGLTGHGAASEKPVLLDQVGCMFEPYVFGLQTSQTLQIRNSDPELHNVHITPRLNPEQNIAQPRRGSVNSFVFKKPEIFLRIKCDVHPWMFSYGCVVDHSFYSVTDTNGGFRLPAGLPAGRYTLTATHLKAGALAQEFEYRPGEPRAFAFQFVVPDATQAQSRNVEPVSR
ncbi:MAG TPA: carboxypeptidase regulatory-like domain-containing protein [Verrucomicrobiae bacterium]|nr:carboxypeptidase regulatory-like domain-containing protein [Verrucomicrobiae bacterium]